MYFLNRQYEVLIASAGTNTEGVIITQAVLNPGGSVCGLAGGFIGGVSGFARCLWNQNHVAEYTWTGIFAGFFLGAAIGFRTPPKLIQTPLFRQVKFALDGLSEALERAQDNEAPNFSVYLEKAYQILFTDYFDNDKDSLDAYLNGDDLEYETGTWGAQFVSPLLAGSVGHHAFIRIPCNGKFFGIEYPPPLQISPSPLFNRKNARSADKK